MPKPTIKKLEAEIESLKQANTSCQNQISYQAGVRTSLEAEISRLKTDQKRQADEIVWLRRLVQHLTEIANNRSRTI